MRFLVSVFSFALFSANAAIKYVDSSVSSSGNGTSWATAWKNISNITGVAAGDIVYISGGPSGSSQTYSMSGSWSPAGGSAGNPITYKIGQDSAHNGTATFSGSGSSYWLAPVSNVIISGDAGDGKMHFAIQNYSQAVYCNNDSNTRISFINFGNIGDGVDGQGVSKFELDHTSTTITGAGADHFMSVGFNDSTWDQSLVHDNIVNVPHQTGASGDGADAFQIGGNGYSFYNNIVTGYDTTYTGGQHQDGWQSLQATYVKIYGNIFLNIGNYAVFADAYYGGFSHVWVYNNIFLITGSSVYPGGLVFGTDGGYQGPSPCTFNDIIFANNLADGYGSSQAFSLNNVSSHATTFTGCVIVNNTLINGGGVWLDNNTTSTVLDNPSLTAAQASVNFVSYSVSGGINNNYHLTSAATSLINQGVNESSYFTTDKDGNPRPAGPWDIGPYEYGASGSNTNPVISVSPTNLYFVSMNNATVTNTLTVRNAGGGTLTGTASVPAPFQIVAGGSYNLANNQSQSVAVSYNPNGGSTNRLITFTGGGGASVPVYGSTTNYPPPTVSPITQTGADVDPNAAGLQIYAGSVVQYSGSASDPSGLPLTWKWIYTVNGGSEIVLTNGTRTVASVSFNYTSGTIGNTYVWKLRVNNGYATSESDLTVGVEAPPVANGIIFPATSGTITAPFVVTGNYISQSVQTVTPASGGSAYYNFTVTNAGNYVIQALVNAPSDAANSFYVNMDAMPQDPIMIWDVPLTSGFEQRIVSWRGNGTDTSNQFVPKYFNLTQGIHQLIIVGREANVQLQSLAVLPVPSPPQNLRIISP